MPSSAVAERSTAPGPPAVSPPPTARGPFLRRQTARLEEEAAALRRELRRSEEETERLPDPGDDALRRARRELDGDLSALWARTLRAVEEALDAIAVGGYGICIDCDKEIPRRRLELTPWARRCVACQRAVEEGEAA